MLQNVVEKKYIVGFLFKVYADGAVVVKKTGTELGYLSSLDMTDLYKGNHERIMVDRFVKERVKIPMTLQKKHAKFFSDIRKSIVKKIYSPRSKCPVTRKDILKYSEYLTELQRIVTIDMLLNKKAALTISQKLNINKFYVYKLKSDSIKKILALKERLIQPKTT